MALDTQAIINAVASHAAASGYLERVNQHEAVSPPGNGLTAAVWVDRIQPVERVSGLAASSVRLALFVRIYTSAIQEPRDAIDPELVAATDALMNAYTGDFTLGGLVSYVDLLGIHRVPLEARAGYVEVKPPGQSAGITYRVMTISLPLICVDVWDQEA